MIPDLNKTNMRLSELFLNRYLYRDNMQDSETKDAAFLSADSSDSEPASIPSGGAAQDINTGNVEIDGSAISPGTIPTDVLDVSNWGWGQTCAFTSTDGDTVSWGAGTFTSASGVAYSISAGNTGNMSAKTYIYLDLNVSETEYQKTTTSSDSVGVGKVLVAVAEDGLTEATYMLSEATQIVGDNITAFYPMTEGAGNTQEVGIVLFTKYLVPFELAAVMLLVAMIAGIVLAGKKMDLSLTLMSDAEIEEIRKEQNKKVLS